MVKPSRKIKFWLHEQLKEMVLALFDESELNLSDEVVETIINKVIQSSA